MTLFYKIVSYLLHPLLFAFIGTAIYLYLTPEHLAQEQEYILLLIVFVSTYVIPILIMGLLKRVGLIEDFHLRTIDERKFPILFFIILTFLLGRTLLNIRLSDLLAFSFFGISIGLSLTYLLFSLKWKTSLHTLGMGGLIGFVAILSYEFELNFNLLLACLFALAGLVGMARLSLKAHSPKEVYLGFAIGLLSQWISYQVYQNM